MHLVATKKRERWKATNKGRKSSPTLGHTRLIKRRVGATAKTKESPHPTPACTGDGWNRPSLPPMRVGQLTRTRDARTSAAKRAVAASSCRKRGVGGAGVREAGCRVSSRSSSKQGAGTVTRVGEERGGGHGRCVWRVKRGRVSTKLVEASRCTHPARRLAPLPCRPKAHAAFSTGATRGPTAPSVLPCCGALSPQPRPHLPPSTPSPPPPATPPALTSGPHSAAREGLAGRGRAQRPPPHNTGRSSAAGQGCWSW